jgi:hypothetical protein
VVSANQIPLPTVDDVDTPGNEPGSGDALLFEIEIKVAFDRIPVSSDLPSALGPTQRPLPGKILAKEETPLQILWSRAGQRERYSRITSSWDQNSLRTLLDEFATYSDQLLTELERNGPNRVVSCGLRQYPDSSGPKSEHVEAVNWTDERCYWARFRRIWIQEILASLPAVVALVVVVTIL